MDNFYYHTDEPMNTDGITFTVSAGDVGVSGTPWVNVSLPRNGFCLHIPGVTCDNCRPQALKSSQCPTCTPRCPHGFPADVAPSQPTITWGSTYPFPTTLASGGNVFTYVANSH